jgi:hypothetical protein
LQRDRDHRVAIDLQHDAGLCVGSETLEAWRPGGRVRAAGSGASTIRFASVTASRRTPVPMCDAVTVTPGRMATAGVRHRAVDLCGRLGPRVPRRT